MMRQSGLTDARATLVRPIDGMPDTPTTVDTLKGIIEAFNRHEVDAVMRYFADDCTLETPRGPYPYGRRFRGKAAVADAFNARFHNIPDARYGDDTHHVHGDTGVSRWTLRGTSLSGERIEVHGCDFYEFRDGVIVHGDTYWKHVD